MRNVLSCVVQLDRDGDTLILRASNGTGIRWFGALLIAFVIAWFLFPGHGGSLPIFPLLFGVAGLFLTLHHQITTVFDVPSRHVVREVGPNLGHRQRNFSRGAVDPVRVRRELERMT